jgi:hypothetical protein
MNTVEIPLESPMTRLNEKFQCLTEDLSELILGTNYYAKDEIAEVILSFMPSSVVNYGVTDHPEIGVCFLWNFIPSSGKSISVIVSDANFKQVLIYLGDTLYPEFLLIEYQQKDISSVSQFLSLPSNS